MTLGRIDPTRLSRAFAVSNRESPGKRDVLFLVQKNRDLPVKIFRRGPGRFDDFLGDRDG